MISMQFDARSLSTQPTHTHSLTHKHTWIPIHTQKKTYRKIEKKQHVEQNNLNVKKKRRRWRFFMWKEKKWMNTTFVKGDFSQEVVNVIRKRDEEKPKWMCDFANEKWNAIFFFQSWYVKYNNCKMGDRCIQKIQP